MGHTRAEISPHKFMAMDVGSPDAGAFHRARHDGAHHVLKVFQGHDQAPCLEPWIKVPHQTGADTPATAPFARDGGPPPAPAQVSMLGLRF